MKKKLETIVCVVAGGVFLASCLWLFGLVNSYRQGGAEYDALCQAAVGTVGDDGSGGLNVDGSGGGSDDSNSSGNSGGLSGLRDFPYGTSGEYPDYIEDMLPGEQKKIDFSSLWAVNPDVVGWIDFPGLTISYPVVQGDNNETYLKVTVSGKRNAAGSIFMDSRNHADLADRNTVIYGHNMRNGSMFGQLKHYQEDEFYRQHPYYYYYTPDGIYRCIIVAAYTVQADISEYPVTFEDDAVYKKYLENVQKRSVIELQAQAAQEDGLMMLSTCNNNASTRFVVQAKVQRLIRRKVEE